MEEERLANSHGFSVSVTDIELVSRARTLILRIFLFELAESFRDPALNLIPVLALRGHFVVRRKKKCFNLWACSTAFILKSGQVWEQYATGHGVGKLIHPKKWKLINLMIIQLHFTGYNWLLQIIQ